MSFNSLTTVHLTKIGFFRSIKFRELYIGLVIDRETSKSP